MDRKLFWLFVTFLLVFSFSSLVVARAVAEVYTDVTVSQAKAMIDTNPSLVLLDVRNQSEYDAGHIRNARLIPVWQLTARLNELNKTDDILVYCAAGARSANASAILVSNGFPHVYNMLEGIKGWKAVGNPAYVRYASLQAAIDNATDGDTLNVSSGLYYENLVIKKSLTLNGENVYTTIVDGRNAGSVISVEWDYVTITGFTIQDSGCSCGDWAGVYSKSMYQSMNLTGNRIVHNDGYGVKLWWAQKVSIVHNEIRNNNDSGILLVGSYYNTVVGNNIANNYHGLYLDGSSDNTIIGNNITGNSVNGVKFETSNNNVFSQNNVEFTLYGVKMYSSSTNLLSGNRLGNNTIGIVLDNSADNNVYHNSFKNDQQVQFQESGLANVWDDGYPSGGNFWSDYAAADMYTGPHQNETGNDGIGDSPQVLDTVNRDNYPLTGMVYDFEFTQNGTPSQLSVISNSTVSSCVINWNGATVYPQTGSLQKEGGNAVLLNVSGPDGTVGFCRFAIPAALMNSTYTVYVDGVNTAYTLLPLSNSTHRYVYFTYRHSAHEILIVPEFQQLIALPFFMAITLLSLVVYRRKRGSDRERARQDAHLDCLTVIEDISINLKYRASRLVITRISERRRRRNNMKYKALGISFLLLLSIIVAFPIATQANNPPPVWTPALYVTNTTFTAPCKVSTIFPVDVYLWNYNSSVVGGIDIGTGYGIYAFDFNITWNNATSGISFVNATAHIPWPTGKYFVIANEHYGVDPTHEGYHLAVTAYGNATEDPSLELTAIDASVLTLMFHVDDEPCYPDSMSTYFILSNVHLQSDGNIPIETPVEIDNGKYIITSTQPDIQFDIANFTAKCVSNNFTLNVQISNAEKVYGFEFYLAWNATLLESNVQCLTIGSLFPAPYEMLVEKISNTAGTAHILVKRPCEKAPVTAHDLITAATFCFHNRFTNTSALQFNPLNPPLVYPSNTTISIVNATIFAKCPDLRTYTTYDPVLDTVGPTPIPVVTLANGLTPQAILTDDGKNLNITLVDIPHHAPGWFGGAQAYITTGGVTSGYGYETIPGEYLNIVGESYYNGATWAAKDPTKSAQYFNATVLDADGVTFTIPLAKIKGFTVGQTISLNMYWYSNVWPANNLFQLVTPYTLQLVIKKGASVLFIWKPNLYDLNLDCNVDMGDLAALAKVYGSATSNWGGLYAPSTVGLEDFVIVAKHVVQDP